MAAQCAWYYRTLKGANNEFQQLWSWFFLAYAISLTFGGFSHLLFHYFDIYGKVPGWTFAILSVSAGEKAMIAEIKDEKKRQTLEKVIRMKLFAALILLFSNLSFTWVMIQTAGLFLFVGILSVQRLKSGQRNYRYFLYGMGCLLMMAVVKITGVDIHPAWFNRDDLAHVFMILGYWAFFVAVSQAEVHQD